MWFKDIFIVIGLIVIAVSVVVGALGFIFDVDQIRNSLIAWHLTEFEALLILATTVSCIVVARLIARLHPLEEKKPALSARPLSFPLSGYHENVDVYEPQKGYAMIAVLNKGGILSECAATVESISRIMEVDGQPYIKELAFTPSALIWDNGQAHVNIPNNHVGKMLRLAYLDQNNPDVWQLALQDESKRQNYGQGWYKVDVVVCSESDQITPLRIETAIGLGDRKTPPSGLNLWPWSKWYRTFKRETGKDIRKQIIWT